MDWQEIQAQVERLSALSAKGVRRVVVQSGDTRLEVDLAPPAPPHVPVDAEHKLPPQPTYEDILMAHTRGIRR